MAAAINASPKRSFIDHITPLASLLNIPLIISDEKNKEITERYYPEVDIRYMPDLEFRLKEIGDAFDTLIGCDYWNEAQTHAIMLHNQKKMKLKYCPHGQSVKG
jgi:hypothetical protein